MVAQDRPAGEEQASVHRYAGRAGEKQPTLEQIRPTGKRLLPAVDRP
jgi:hypothetical protein